MPPTIEKNKLLYRILNKNYETDFVGLENLAQPV